MGVTKGYVHLGLTKYPTNGEVMRIQWDNGMTMIEGTWPEMEMRFQKCERNIDTETQRPYLVLGAYSGITLF